ncbi:MAG TPA: tetratricopeptide repeat protein [Tepidisphaeraceae bacterium]|jgi:tetratricopeptide (TPR) repeat protein|nr:tetratricopeptide repeat protein [Tepidisphaeraceae bacterium]
MSTAKRFNRLELVQQLEQLPTISTSNSSQSLEEHDASYWMTSADTDRRNGQYDNALRHYSRALELDRSLVPGWLGQIQMLILLEEYPEAELWARKALELFRNHPGLLAGRSQAFCRTGDLRQAQALCDVSISQQGQTAYCWVARGEIMLARRDPVEQYCFDKALQIDADWLQNLEIAAIYLHYSLPAKALIHCRSAVEKSPAHPYCWYVQGSVELTLSLTRPAENSFRRCLELKPNHADAHRALGNLHKGRGFFSRLLRRHT